MNETDDSIENLKSEVSAKGDYIIKIEKRLTLQDI